MDLWLKFMAFIGRFFVELPLFRTPDLKNLAMMIDNQECMEIEPNHAYFNEAD